MPLEVQSIKIESLTLDPQNARKHEATDVDAIARSLKQFGQQSPIVVTADGLVVKGNGTVMAAMKLGWSQVDAVETKLTGDDLRAYAIADNKTGLLSDWDWDRLAEQLNALEGELLEATAFNQEEIDDILARLSEEVSVDDLSEDEVPSLPSDAKSKVGEVYRLGDHCLAVGDCLDGSLLDRLFESAGCEQADMVFTDPPYNVDYEGGSGLKIQNDKMATDKFREWLLDVFRVIETRLSVGGGFYICHADSEGLSFRGALEASGLLMKQCLIWVKNSLVLGRQDYHWRHEPILYGWKSGKKHRWYGGRKKDTVLEEMEGVSVTEEEDGYRLSICVGGQVVELAVDGWDVLSSGDSETVWRVERPSRSKDHPTMKPVRLVGRAVENSSRRGHFVFDPFGGSGTTMICCEQMGRRALLVELDPRYADVIIQRWEKFTDLKAELLSGPPQKNRSGRTKKGVEAAAKD